MKIKELEIKIQKHLESAITHGWNDAQQLNDGLGEVCRMEAQQNLRNAMSDIQVYTIEKQQEIIKKIRSLKHKDKDWVMGVSKQWNEALDKVINYLELELLK